MNILLFSRIVAKSGVGNHMKQLSEELVRQGHYVIVVSSTNDLQIGRGTSQVDFVELDVTSLNPIVILKQVRELHKIILDRKIDIVHCHHRMAALYMKVYRIFYRIPMVYTLHLANVPADVLHRSMTFVGDKAIGVSTEVSNFLVEKLRVNKSKVVTIFNGVDEKQLLPLSVEEKESLRERWNVKPSNIVFAMHSRIDEVKNHALVVEAVRMMSKEEREKVKIICSGSQTGSYYEKIAKIIDEYGLNESFVFTGWANTRDILGISDALILTSTNEGFPLSVVEAFLLKVPVLRTRTGGFDDQRYCFELMLNNPQQVKEEMLKIVKDKADYREHVEKAYEYAWNNFTVEKMTGKTVTIYQEVI